jgi:two-component system sensor histidine kinase RegB
MKIQAPLSQFSEPQAVLFLLGWLRLVTASLLVVLCGLSEWINIDSVQSLLQWRQIIVISVLVFFLSIFTHFIKHKDISHQHIAAILLLDIMCWTGLMAASGGSINPGISYLLILLAIAGLALSRWQAIGLTLLSIFLYAWMMKIQPPMHHRQMMDWHLWGMWLLFMMNAVAMLIVVTLLSKALREKDKAIANYREETVRNEQLVSMGTMAANIAHEIGTPLSTISILLEDADVEEKPLMLRQLDRCKTALQQLKNTAQNMNISKIVHSSELLKQWVHECLLLQPQANVHYHDKLQQSLTVSPLLDQAILALLNNAIEAASSRVNIDIEQQNQHLTINIRHDGKAVNADLLNLLGRQAVSSSKQGLGLGYYLANASIEQLGGTVQLSNTDTGVLTRVEFPVTAFMGAA